MPKGDPNYLSTEAGRRLAGGPVRFELCIQRYRDERSTPIEDTGVEWTERVSPPEPVAVLTLPQGDITTVDALAQARIIDATGVQPVEHDRRVPSAGQPEPGAQGGVRRQRRAPAGQPVGVARRRCATG